MFVYELGMHGPFGRQTLWSYVMLGILCNTISYRQIHKNRVRELRMILFEKKSQLKSRKAGQDYKTGKGQAKKSGTRREAPKKRERYASPGLELTHVHNSKVLELV